MRKNNVVSKDKRKRRLVKKFELKKLFFSMVVYTKIFSLGKYRKYALFYLNTLPKNSSFVRVKNYCIITGRNKGIYRKFKISRIKIRELLVKNLLPNYIKST